MWIRIISFAVGVHRLTSPFTHAISRTDTFKGKKLIESCCAVFQLKSISEEGIAGSAILGLACSNLWCKRCRTRIVASIEDHVQTVQFSLNQILPTLFTLRNEESKIIAVMSSNVDDLLYGYLPEGAEAMNSVLQQFLVGKEEHGTFRFCVKEFRQDEDFGIRVTAQDNTERTWLDTNGYCK